MKKLYYLVNHELKNLFIPTLLLGSFLIVIEYFISYFMVKTSYEDFFRLEELMASPLHILTFVICFLGLLALLAYNFYSNYKGSHSIYTLLTLPISRYTLYFAKLISYMFTLGLFLSMQLLSLILRSTWYTYFITHSYRLNMLESPWPIMENVLALALIRSPSLHFLLPFGMLSFLSNLGLFFIGVTGVLYLFLLERHQKYGYCLMTFIITISIVTYTFIIRLSYDMPSMSHWLINLIFLYTLSLYYICHSMKLIRQIDTL